MYVLSKWLILLAILVAIVGCGGDNTGINTTGTNGSNRSAPIVNLGDKGELQFVVASGQGRRDVGSNIAILKLVQFIDDEGNYVPTLDQSTFPEMKIQLDGYTLNARSFSVDINPTQGSRFFNEFPFEINSIQQVTDTGGTQTVTTIVPAFQTEFPFDLSLVMYAGRQSSVQINLDDAMVTVVNDGLDTVAALDELFFIDRNYDIRTDSIRGFLSDYVGWDVSNMPIEKRPTLLDGSVSSLVLFSGDGIAQASEFGVDNAFELLDPIRIQGGIITPGPILGGSQAPGSYQMREPDPRDLLEIARLTALQGSWKPYTSFLTNLSDANMITFPNSEDELEQQLVYWVLNSEGKITDMYQGVIRINDTLTGGTFSMWPIAQVDDADAANEVSGTISGLQQIGGIVKRGNWDVTAGSFPYAKSGGFSVFRK